MQANPARKANSPLRAFSPASTSDGGAGIQLMAGTKQAARAGPGQGPWRDRVGEMQEGRQERDSAVVLSNRFCSFAPVGRGTIALQRRKGSGVDLNQRRDLSRRPKAAGQQGSRAARAVKCEVLLLF
jgi:hypothetical protein